MAVEKMEYLNIIAPKNYSNEILANIIFSEKIHIVDSYVEIKKRNFLIEENSDDYKTHKDLLKIKRFEGGWDCEKLQNKLEILMDDFNIERKIDRNFISKNYSIILEDETCKRYENMINTNYALMEPLRKMIEDEETEIEKLMKMQINLNFIENKKLPLYDIFNSKYLDFKMGYIPKERVLKIKKNYENISSLIFNIGEGNYESMYLFACTKDMVEERENLLKSLNFSPLLLDENMVEGDVKKTIDNIEKKIREEEAELLELKLQLKKYKEEKKNDLKEAYSLLMLKKKIFELKNKMAFGDQFMYVAGWVPKSCVKDLDKIFDNLKKQIIFFYKENKDEISVTPPTKLKNNFISKNFEILVKLYGIPAYKEVDPTNFLAITYLLFFGAMFGDVGQGAVFLVFGIFLNKKDEFKPYGKILMSLGCSSIVFGFLYGSIFGFEDLILPLFIRPIENINYVLSISVLFGVILIFLSFILSFVNLMKQREFKEVIFSKNGISGFLLYSSLLLIIAHFIGIKIIDIKLAFSLMSVFILMMILKVPILNVVLKEKEDYDGGIKAYFTESIFEMIETLMGFMSNTISFIRIGAFALNHVGLFLAFLTMAELINNGPFSILILIIGNIVIITLEGLIVFIQGLRLEYYELFSKYFKGDGVEYKPFKLEY
ncbi:V-type ATPase 116kDa subunit family protein [Peptostreptococcaceae bacterium AGR-M142]